MYARSEGREKGNNMANQGLEKKDEKAVSIDHAPVILTDLMYAKIKELSRKYRPETRTSSE
jgi:hypothetical protein